MVKVDGSYEKKYQELESIIEKLQSSEVGLDEAVESYQRGMKLISELESILKDARNKVTEIKAKLK